MIIKEQGLLRAMKEAYKGGGYKAMVYPVSGCNWLFVLCGYWLAGMDLQNAPRKVIGLIAEHLGKLPTVGEAYKLRKDEAQKEIFDVAAGPVRDIVEKTAVIEGLPKVKRTRLEWDGSQIWQKDNLDIVKMNPDYTDVAKIGKQDDTRMAGVMLLLRGEISLAAICGMTTSDAERHQMDHLAQLQWVDI